MHGHTLTYTLSHTHIHTRAHDCVLTTPRSFKARKMESWAMGLLQALPTLTCPCLLLPALRVPGQCLRTLLLTGDHSGVWKGAVVTEPSVAVGVGAERGGLGWTPRLIPLPTHILVTVARMARRAARTSGWCLVYRYWPQRGFLPSSRVRTS